MSDYGLRDHQSHGRAGGHNDTELLEIVARGIPASHAWEPRLHGAGCNVGGCEMSWEEHTEEPPPRWDEVVRAREALAALLHRHSGDPK